MKSKLILMLLFLCISIIMPSIASEKKDLEFSPFVTYIPHTVSKLLTATHENDTDSILDNVGSFSSEPSRDDLPNLHECSTLLVSCIDFRLRDEVEKFMRETLHLLDSYDEVVLPGASLAITASMPGHGKVDNSPDAKYYLKQNYYDSLRESAISTIKLAREKHHIKRVILLDHSKCAAYALCKKDYDATNEVNEHKGELACASQEIRTALERIGTSSEPLKVYSLYFDLNTPEKLEITNFHQLGL